MATRLYLYDTQNNGIGSTYRDMHSTVPTSGAASYVTATTADGTEIQVTTTSGGAIRQWVSGRVPAGGFTLTTATAAVDAGESNMAANVGGRARIFKRTSDGTETELGGGPFDDGVEWPSTGTNEHTWTANVTDTAFAENDRILLKLYLTNVGTMGGGHTGSIFAGFLSVALNTYLEIAENVTFKSEVDSLPIFGTRPRILKRRF